MKVKTPMGGSVCGSHVSSDGVVWRPLAPLQSTPAEILPRVEIQPSPSNYSHLSKFHSFLAIFLSPNPQKGKAWMNGIDILIFWFIVYIQGMKHREKSLFQTLTVLFISL